MFKLGALNTKGVHLRPSYGAWTVPTALPSVCDTHYEDTLKGPLGPG